MTGTEKSTDIACRMKQTQNITSCETGRTVLTYCRKISQKHTLHVHAQFLQQSKTLEMRNTLQEIACYNQSSLIKCISQLNII